MKMKIYPCAFTLHFNANACSFLSVSSHTIRVIHFMRFYGFLQKLNFHTSTCRESFKIQPDIKLMKQYTKAITYLLHIFLFGFFVRGVSLQFTCIKEVAVSSRPKRKRKSNDHIVSVQQLKDCTLIQIQSKTRYNWCTHQIIQNPTNSGKL